MLKNAERRQRIFLVGMMGSGKTTVGKLLAHELEYDLIDIDAVIEEHAGTSISNFFAMHGEETFRRLETAVLIDTANRIKLVFSTGGGILESDDSREIILNTGLVVWLKCHVDSLVERVGAGQERPMLHPHDVRSRMEELLITRIPNYEKSHLTIDADRCTPPEIVRQIVNNYRIWLTLDEN